MSSTKAEESGAVRFAKDFIAGTGA
jgi:hypothetical protein